MAAPDQLHREENTCQQGAIHTWHIPEVPTADLDGCLRIQSVLRPIWLEGLVLSGGER